MSRTTKEFIKFFGPFALIILVVSAWVLHSSNQNNLKRVGERQGAVTALVSHIITRELATHASDTQFLARLVARHLSNQQGTSLRDIEDAFTDFARSRQFYFILRYLDDTGAERVRVDRSFAGPVISPASILQNKSGRYYFKETMRAGKNDVYISNFDLNIEHGRIEVPYRPTLRFGCPVIDNSGRKRGVIILNFDGKAILNQIKMEAESSEGVTMLCNGEGFWMLGPDPKDEWGHLLDNASEASMPKRFPLAWKAISSTDRGQIMTGHGLFSYDTIGIIPGTVMSDVPPSAQEAKKRWKILTWVPTSALNVPWMKLFFSLITLALIILGTGCWHLADYRVRQAEVEERLRENEERTLAISQSAQDAIVMIDEQDRITHWNPAAQRMFGYTLDEVQERKLHDFLVPGHMQKDAQDGMAHFAATGHGKTLGKVLEFDALCKDGSTVPVELAVSSFRFKGSWYAVGSIRNITRRKQSELALKRSEETSRALINAPTESAMLIEPNGTIVAINEVGAHRLGGNVEEMVGKNAYEFISPNLVTNRKTTIMRVLETGEPTQFEDTRADRRMLISVYPVMDPDGSVNRLAIFARDVTEQRMAESALIRSEQRFRDVSEAVGEFIWETDPEAAITFITEDVFSVLGYTAYEITHSSHYDFIPKEDVEGYKKWQAGVYERREAFSNVEIRNITKDGRIIWLQISGVPYFDDAGEFMGFRGAAMNITDRKAHENAVKASERKLRALAESTYDAIIMIDTNGLISFWNNAAKNLFGYAEEEALGRNVHDLIAPEDMRTKADAGMYQFAMTGNGPAVGAIQETMALHKDGHLFPVERSVSGFRLSNQWYAVATIRDITERKATEAKLLELATTDGLTGLYNRRRFMELCEREFARSIRYNRPLAMFMLDIDHFKKVNDTHGHDVGDEVLRALSEISIMALRNADILGRLGGEEFGVLLPETDSNSAMEVAERLRLSIERTSIATNAASLNITVSIGVAILTPETDTIQNLLKKADVALYDAKQSGRNRVILN